MGEGGLRADARRNRQRILAAAREVFAELGPAARMDAVAVRAGLAVGTLYRHYPTKAALLQAAVAERVEQARDEAAAAVRRVDGGADPARELDGLLRGFAHTQWQDRGWKAAAGVVVTYDDGPARAALAIAADLLARAQGGGGVRDDVTVSDLLLLLGGLPGTEVALEVHDRCLDVVLSGLRRRGRPAPG